MKYVCEYKIRNKQRIYNVFSRIEFILYGIFSFHISRLVCCCYYCLYTKKMFAFRVSSRSSFSFMSEYKVICKKKSKQNK